MKRELAQLHVAPGNWTKIVVPVSGGKDSQACMALACDAAGPENVLGVHQHTGFDHPLTYAHMDYMRGRYKVEIIDVRNPQFDSVPDVMLQQVMLPSRHARLCTRLLKTGPWFKWLKEQENPFGFLIFLGMRTAESQARKENYGSLANLDVYQMGDISGECPASLRTVRAQLPIVTRSTPWVFEFLRKRGDKINPLYAMGHKRVGCFPCALAGKASMKLTVRDPVGRQHIGMMSDAIQLIEWARPELRIEEFFDHDLEDLLNHKEADPFGFNDEDDEQVGGCSWCNL
jgi:3'-phosphoadenosine 5'-phosphosulfate sulfotransferase (PAPS reductase)/FAD synthetase